MGCGMEGDDDNIHVREEERSKKVKTVKSLITRTF